MARRFGWGRGWHLGLGRITRDPALRERLGITDEQAAKIRSAQSQFAKQQIQRQAELRIKRMELAELLRADNPDRAAIEKKLRELNDLELQARMAGLDYGLAMRNLLTPEQREQLKQLARERMAQRFPGRWGFGPSRQHGPGMGPRGPQAPPRQPQPPAE
jgi:Spy/CpxP family protein refolding chaperone